MRSLPLFARIEGRPVLLLGDGEAAAAKARLIAEAGGRVVRDTASGARLAFVALDDGAEEAAGALQAAGLLVNVVDRPDLCDFTVPAILERGDVLLAIGTDGRSASLAKALKERLDRLLPAALGALAQAIHAARPAVAARHPTVPARRAFWAGLLAQGAPLDPLAPAADPHAAIHAALADAPSAPVTDLAVIDYAEPFDQEALTLGQLRRLAAADLLIHPENPPPALLALARRDCARQIGREPPAQPGGRVVLCRPAAAPA